MATETTTKTGPMMIDKRWLQEEFAKMDAQSGFVLDPTATADKVQEMMLADGVRREDNSGSREIIRERYPDDYEK